MLLGCCHCGQEQSSSVASSAASSGGSGSAGSGSQAFSSASQSASSGSGAYPTVPCSYCSTGVGPASFMMTWSLANNCPASGVFADMEVGCYDQAYGVDGAHFGIASSAAFEAGSFRCPDPGYSGCFWQNNSTGEVTITRTGYGTCGTCAAGPWIGIIVGQDGGGTYFIHCFIYFYYGCTNGSFPDPSTGESGYIFLHYSKTSEQPLNCMVEQQLDLVCSDGFDEFTDPPGTEEWGGLGPGCNYVTHAGTNFPSTVTIGPDTGGGTFP